MADGAHVGNIHFSPNGLSDYDYSNTKYVNAILITGKSILFYWTSVEI